MSKIYKTFSFLFLLTFGIRMLDVVKNLIIASKVGVSGSADVFFALQFIPDYLVVLFGIDTLKGVINSEYSTLIKNNNVDYVRKSFANIFSYLLILSLFLTSVIFIFRGDFVPMLLPGLSVDNNKVALLISVFIFPVFFFRSIVSLVQPYFNANKKYYLPVITQVTVTFAIIFFIYFPIDNSSLVYNISFGFLIGNLIYFIIIIIPVFPDIVKNKSEFFKFNSLTKKIFHGCLTLLLLSIINQLYLFSRNNYASYFPEGSLSSISYGYSIPYFVSTLTFNVVFSVLLTHLSSFETCSEDIKHRMEESEKLLFKTMFMIYYIYIPIVILFVSFSEKILSIVFLRGNFSLDGIALTSRPFIWESLSLLTYVLYIVPVIMYLSLKKYKSVMIYGCISFSIGILFNYLASRLFGYYGISVSNFFTMGIYGSVLIIGLKSYFSNLKNNIILLIRLIIAFIASFVIIYLLKFNIILNYSDKSIVMQIINVITNYLIICIVFIFNSLIFVNGFTVNLYKELTYKILSYFNKKKIPL